MSKLHKLTYWFAAIHFTVCAIVGAVVSGIEILCGMPSGGYQPIALVIGVMDKIILLLEAPVALILWLLYHPTARFQPPLFCVIDIVGSTPFSVVVGLCFFWSVIFGCLVSYGIRKFKK